MSLSSKLTKGNTERASPTYKLYAINVHGSSMASICCEFIRNVNSGLRKKLFLIDLDLEIARQSGGGDANAEGSEIDKSSPELQEKLVTLTVNAIDKCRERYDAMVRTMSAEGNFEILSYWTKSLKAPPPKKAAPERAPEKRKTVKMSQMQTYTVKCPNVAVKEHNHIGRTHLLTQLQVGNKHRAAKRSHNGMFATSNIIYFTAPPARVILRLQYIEDEPENSGLYIFLLGELSNQFYINLLSRGQPLQAISNFLPAITGYDRLIPNPERQENRRRTLENIHVDTIELRKFKETKPVGIFQLQLPVISICEAELHGKTIFDQLTWYHYDIEMLQRQYEEYYFKPFDEVDVTMDEKANLQQSRDTAESLSVQGHYLLEPYPAIGTDSTTAWLYLDSLLNLFGDPENMPNKQQIKLLSSSHVLSVKNQALNSLLCMWDIRRLFVEHSNRFFEKLLCGSEMMDFQNVHVACLEYNSVYNYIQRVITTPLKIGDRHCRHKEHFLLPNYTKFFTSHDATQQRLLALLNQYEDYEVNTVHRHFRVFHFRRPLDEIIVQRKLNVIPTRLCFREFTLFQLDQFLQLLVTPEMFYTPPSETEQLSKALDQQIFIRPTSIKAVKLIELLSDRCLPRKGRPTEPPRPSQIHKRPGSVAYMGLPPHHRFLYGYNLEDTRQEIHTHNCYYHFVEGTLRLYKEHWCFTETNKTLLVRLNGNDIFLNFAHNPETADHHHSGIIPNIRLITKNDIAIRMLQDDDECSKVIINYPNGLSIYHHECYVEQLWHQVNSHNRERTRIYTAEGTIIVSYNEEEFVLVMRYNGEVYKLIQSEEQFEEMEEEGEMTEEHTNTSNQDEPPLKSQAASVSLRESLAKPSRQVTQTAATTSSSEATIDFKSMHCRHNETHLYDKLNNELRYLLYITTVYNLGYIRVLITTSQGLRVYMKRNGRICTLPPLKNVEWHDYYANESYAMRSDGVQMIWTADALKCFHSDGSVLTTKLHASIASAFDEELDSLITVSSSHLNVRSCEPSDPIVGSGPNDMLSMPSEMSANRNAEELLANGQFRYLNEQCEPEEFEDRSYISITCDECLMQHDYYAGVSCASHRNSNQITRRSFEIQANDEVNVQYETATTLVQPHATAEHLEDGEEEHTDADADAATVELKKSLNLLVRVGETLTLSVAENSLKISATLQRYDAGKGLHERGDLQLCTKFSDDLTETFHKWAIKISKFKNQLKRKYEEVYFIERLKSDCSTQGFEFFNELVTIPDQLFVHATRNTRTEFYNLLSTNEAMANKNEALDKDRTKFPRFPQRVRQRQQPIDKCPMISSVRVFYMVPRQLRCVGSIHKFLEPFENVTFKKLRHQLKDSITFLIRPWVNTRAKRLASLKNWQLKKEDHQRRLFREQQMKGLYNAILRYKKFPKYHKFMTDYQGHVRHIHFFEYINLNCPLYGPMP